MAKGSSVIVALGLLVLLVVQPGQAAVDCGEAKRRLAPCGPYLTGSSPNPTTPCCSGVQYIKDNTVTKADKQTTCQCLKDTATQIVNLKDGAAQQLAGKCKVPIDVPISKTVDCNKL